MCLRTVQIGRAEVASDACVVRAAAARNSGCALWCCLQHCTTVAKKPLCGFGPRMGLWTWLRTGPCTRFAYVDFVRGIPVRRRTVQ